MASGELSGLIDRAREALAAGEYSDARLMFHTAARQLRKERLPEELAYVLRHAAQAELELGKHEKALSDSTEALGFYLLMPDTNPLNLANTKRLIALALEGNGLMGEARNHWRAAREIYQEASISEGVAECDSHLENE